jgi:hypothetical protein
MRPVPSTQHGGSERGTVWHCGTAEGVSALSTAAEAELVVAPNQLADSLDSFAGCFGLRRDLVAYVSTPITTGKRYYDWLQASGRQPTSDPEFVQAHLSEVIEVNSASAHALVVKVRQTLPKVVVDPTGLSAPGWAQEDFHAFWTRLITDYVGTVVFNDGWEYSTGCCWEFAAAIRVNAILLDANLSPLAPTVALMQTNDAIQRLCRQGHKIDGLATARRAIEHAAANTVHEQGGDG